jgi:hypothetical protein
MGKNFISLKNHYSLSKWLEGNTAKLSALTRIEAAALATQELGFTVTESNMYGAIAAAGLEIKFRRMKSPNPPRTQEGTKNKCIAVALRDLMQALNYPVPAYINAIADGLTTDVVEHFYNKAHNRTSS